MICRCKMLYISGMARVDVAIILAMAACTGTGFIQGTSVQMVVLISSTDSEIPEGVTSSGIDLPAPTSWFETWECGGSPAANHASWRGILRRVLIEPTDK